MNVDGLIVLSPVGMEHTPGSVVVMAGCGHAAWISPGGIESQARLSVETICMGCVDSAEIPEFTVTPEVYRSLVDAVGVKAADECVANAESPLLRQLVFAEARRVVHGK